MSETLKKVREAFAEAYEVEREVGQGGMATVYLARDLKHNRQVALKVVRPELASAMGGERFPREIAIIAQLSHPHILPLHDSGERGGYLYYVMPFVEGESLRDRLKRDGALSVTRAVKILREVTDALAYAHERGIVHRDIKPDNVMLSGRHALVTDFGVAKAVSAASGEKLTTVGVALGTPAYMSPEQAMGETDVDHRSDIYALGAMAYEMLTGETPFERPTAQAILSAHVLDTPEDVATKAHVPQVLGELIMRCLAKDKDDRWQTAEQMLPMLESAVTPSGGMTPTDTRPIKATLKPKKRSRRVVIGSLAAAILAVGGVGTALALGGGGDGAIERIAVLPIQDLSGQDDVFVDAMHDQLITGLAQANVVGVVSRTAVMPYRGGAATTGEIAAALGVQAVVEGTIFRDGSRVRINVQMVDPGTLRYLWTQSYERDASDVLAMQSELVASIAADLSAALTAIVNQGE